MPEYNVVSTTNYDTGTETVTVVPQSKHPKKSIQMAGTAGKAVDAAEFAGVNSPRLRKTVILIMGATGVGKSSFIATTSEQPVVVGHGLRSCTSDCQAWEFQLDSNHVIQLVDTPGFNDTTRSDMDILASISSWIQANRGAVAGVVYLHRITDKRFTGASRMNLDILKAMCGEHFFSHIILSTSMWGGLPSERAVAEAEAREKELQYSPEFWNDMLKKGAGYERFLGSRESGHEIIKAMLAKHAAPPMSVELELRDRSLEDTAAGQLITAEIRRREGKLRQELLEEEEEERQLKEDLELEQEAVRREEQRQRERETMTRRRLEVGPAGENRGTTDMARRAAQASWPSGPLFIGFEVRFPRRQR